MKINLRKKSVLKIVAVIVLVLCLNVSKASALTLSPIRMEIHGNPGDTLTEQMTLINETAQPVTYYSSFANFEAQGESGNPAFVEPQDDLGTWMSTEKSITLEPKENKTLVFLVNIPKDAEPGGHFAALFWGTVPNTPGSSQVAIGAKTGLLVLLSVNGEVKEAGGLTIFNLKDNKFWYNTLPVDFEYKFRNDGNDRIKPTGKLTIRDMVYLPADRLDGNPVAGNILPNSTRKFNITWVKNPRSQDFTAPEGTLGKFFDTVKYQWNNFAVGLYSAHLKLTFGTKAEAPITKVLYFFVFPWQLLLVMLIVLLIVFWGGGKLLARYNKFIIEKAEAGMKPSAHSHHEK